MDEAITIEFLDRDGQMLFYSDAVTDKQCNTEIVLSKEDARDKAREIALAILNFLVNGAGGDPQEYHIAKIFEPELEIVIPNRCDREVFDKEDWLKYPLDGRLRLAYAVEVHYGFHGQDWTRSLAMASRQIYVDVATGEFLGTGVWKIKK